MRSLSLRPARSPASKGEIVYRLQDFGLPPPCYPSYEASDFNPGRSISCRTHAHSQEAQLYVMNTVRTHYFDDINTSSQQRIIILGSSHCVRNFVVLTFYK